MPDNENKSIPISEQLSSPPSAQMKELRREYSLTSLDELSVHPDPFVQFENWFTEATSRCIEAGNTAANSAPNSAPNTEPNAMTLATISPDNSISARIVLLKNFSKEGFVFFTNYESRKGRAIEFHSQVALLFYWAELERQVRIEGIACKTTDETSDEYFTTRPFRSQVSAIASPQSHVVTNRAVLEEKFTSTENELYAEKLRGRMVQGEMIQDGTLQGVTPPRPKNWGGYCVRPQKFEFWQGRRDRLHDRIEYNRSDNQWYMQRLAP